LILSASNLKLASTAISVKSSTVTENPKTPIPISPRENPKSDGKLGGKLKQFVGGLFKNEKDQPNSQPGNSSSQNSQDFGSNSTKIFF
jgi:hypothetical protein